MAAKETYQYSRGPIGVPSVLLALGWVVIWFLWPSFESGRTGNARRRPSRTHVSYGIVDDSLHMSPLLFARATRVGFQAPEEAVNDTELLDRERRMRNLRYLHVEPPDPDYAALRRLAAVTGPVKQMDGYRPVWKDSADFAVTVRMDAVMVDVRGPLRERGYQPGPITWPEDVEELQRVEIEAFVGIDAEGVTDGVFLEKGSGSALLDAHVIRALEWGKATPGPAPASGRVTVTMRRANER